MIFELKTKDFEMEYVESKIDHPIFQQHYNRVNDLNEHYDRVAI